MRARVLELVAEGGGEGIEQRLGPVVHRLERARHVAGDGSGDEDAPAAGGEHLRQEAVEEVERPRHVRVDDALDVAPLLVDEGTTEPAAGVGDERGDGPAADGGDERVDALARGEVGLDGLGRGAEPADGARRRRRMAGSSAATMTS